MITIAARSRSYRGAPPDLVGAPSPDFVGAPSPDFVGAPSRCDKVIITVR